MLNLSLERSTGEFYDLYRGISMTKVIIKVELHEHMKILSEKELKNYIKTIVLKDVVVIGTVVGMDVENYKEKE